MPFTAEAHATTCQPRGWVCRRNAALITHGKHKKYLNVFLSFFCFWFFFSQFIFKVKTMSSLSLAWVGDASGVSLWPEMWVKPNEGETFSDVFALISQVLLVFTTFQVPLFMMHFAQSNLYRRWEIPETWRYAATLSFNGKFQCWCSLML